ncbi:MAG: hypothetical protein H3Z54_09850 [archaeon]|nr:hypothetical protein [archaeon]MCP8316360.1 hypothetical protein [archaeon]
MELFWEKPVIVFYKERAKRESKALAVIKARRLTIRKDEESGKFKGTIQDFFPFMGDIDYISSPSRTSDRYVICWMDDREDDFSKAWRRLNGVTFPKGFVSITDDKGKRTYNANFEAKHGKLE